MANLNKVKVRNLDEDVLNLFRKNGEKIPYDSLDQEIINEIKNGAGTNKYNDAELRSRIIKLEGDKLDKKLAATTYMTVENSFSKEEIDNMTKALKDNIDLKLSSDTADQRYIKKLDGCISENLLSEDLINKVNARYENKRPEETGSGSEVNTSDFNLLKVQVNNNTTGITNLKNYVDSNVLTTNNKITKNYLDESIVSTLDNSRLKSVLIGMSDLSEDVKKKLSNTISGSFDTLEENIQENKNSIDEITKWLGIQNGNVLMGDLGSTSTHPVLKQCPIFAEDIVLIDHENFNNNFMQNMFNEEVKYIIVLMHSADTNDVLYEYTNVMGENATYDEAAWQISKTIGPTEVLAGRFAIGYGTCVEYYSTIHGVLGKYRTIQNLYFGTSIDEFEKIIDIEEIYDCVLNNIKQYGKIIKKDISETYATKDQISALESNVDTKVSRLKTQIESLKAQVESLKTQVESLKNPTP